MKGRTMALRVGVVGAGAIGLDHIRRLHSLIKGVEVVAVSDADPGKEAIVRTIVP
jgi:myo-inositol 2-dehydrogenase/D-chiro-inositol 1-dehydrogenase